MLASENLVTNLNDELVAFFIEALAHMIRVGCRFLQDGIGANHLARNQILANAEVFK